MMKDFIGWEKYLFDWKSSEMTRDGNFSQNARDCKFLNWQTF